MANNEKKTKGRQKLPLALIEKESNRMVTFSKRRLGLFKKINELCILCGVEAACIVFSPGNKAFSFGHPSVDAIIDRYMESNTEFNNHPEINDGGQAIYREEEIQSLSFQITNIKGHTELERRRGGELLNRRRSKGEEYYQWLNPVEGYSLQDLNQIYKMLEQLMKTTCQIYGKSPTGASGSRSGFGSEFRSGSESNFYHDIKGSQLAIKSPFCGESNKTAIVLGAASTSNSLNGLDNSSSSQMMMVPSPKRCRFANPSIKPTSLAMDLLNVDGNKSVEDLSSILNLITDHIPSPHALGFPNLSPSPNYILKPNLNPISNTKPTPFVLGSHIPNPSPIAISLTNPNLNSMDVGFCNPNFKVEGFTTPNFWSTYHGENNPMTHNQFHNIPLSSLQPFNVMGNNHSFMSSNFQGFQNEINPPVHGFQGSNPPMLGNFQGIQGNNNSFMLGNFEDLQGNNNPHILDNSQGLQGNNNASVLDSSHGLQGNFQSFTSMPPVSSDMNALAPPPPPFSQTFNLQGHFGFGTNDKESN